MTFPSRRGVSALLLALGLLVFGSLHGFAYDSVGLKLGTLEGSGWSARNVVVQVGWLDESHVRLHLSTDSVSLHVLPGQLSDLDLLCERAVLNTRDIHCPDARLRLRSSEYGRQTMRVSFRYHPEGANWDVTIKGARLPLEKVTAQLAAAGSAIPVLESNGHIAVSASLRGTGPQLLRADMELRLKAQEFTDAGGTVAGEDLDIALVVDARPAASGWQLALDMTGHRGGLYIDPVYLVVPSQPIRATARLDWQGNTRRLVVHAFEYHHPGSVDLRGSGRFSFGPTVKTESMQIEISDAVFPSLYDTYMQPWLTGSALGDLQISGQASGGLTLQDGALQNLSLDLQGLSLDDREGLFGLENVLARIRWSDSGVAEQSEVQWAGGHVYRIGLGPARIAAESGSGYVRLQEAAQLPVLDGALQIDSFNLAYGEDKPLRWEVDGFMTPVSMKLLTQALGWPEFSGKLSGVIPDVRYEAGNLEVGGVLLVRVFGGEVTLRNLRLEQPFGVVPRLWVDAQAVNIDLETLTRTFSFGKIEGALDGRIDGLQMESWRPVAFDAEFATPEGDDSRHRISQKAVDNISSIGGAGIGGALSRSFLRFFEDFPYERLGIRCRLENGVCAMGGVEPTVNGYYLVKGRFIPPRLDVIGFADRVDWDSLVSQIAAVTGEQDVVVQ
ncbi:MAG: hypothetical protein KAJ06_00875 [Gammaproteobacteria bacterium]|nr:hypothetical protein [Gammaproteobacteria bacterium]